MDGSADDKKPQQKKGANPLPYIISFAVLFVVTLVVLTWVLDVFYKAQACGTYPNIWCSDTWTCTNNCPGAVNPSGYPVSQCFENVGTTGLSSCLFGPNAAGATACYFTPSGDGGLSCDCVASMQNTPNCYSGCAQSLDDITGPCCCDQSVNPNCTNCSTN